MCSTYINVGPLVYFSHICTVVLAVCLVRCECFIVFNLTATSHVLFNYKLAYMSTFLILLYRKSIFYPMASLMYLMPGRFSYQILPTPLDALIICSHDAA